MVFMYKWKMLHMPDKFTYKKELIKYKNIDIARKDKTSNNDYYDYNQWCKHINETCEDLDEAERKQLYWALQKHKNQLSLMKEIWSSACLPILLFFIGYLVSSANTTGNSIVWINFILALIVELSIVLPISRINSEIEFIDDVFKAADTIPCSEGVMGNVNKHIGKIRNNSARVP